MEFQLFILQTQKLSSTVNAKLLCQNTVGNHSDATVCYGQLDNIIYFIQLYNVPSG